MRKKSRLRAAQLEKFAAQELEARSAAMQAAAADAAARVLEQTEALERTRESYDSALAASGVVLFQQVEPGCDGFHLSRSMRQVFGWDPEVFANPGMLRGMVHPDDLEAFGALVPLAVNPLLPTSQAQDNSVIDLTVGSKAQTSNAESSPFGDTNPIDATSRPATHNSTEASVRFRSAHGSWSRVLVRISNPKGDAAASSAGSSTGSSTGSCLQGSLVDVTHGESDRTALSRFAELVKNDPAGCLVLEFIDPADPTSLTIRAANPSAQRMLDIEPASVDGTTIDMVFAEPSAQLIRSALFNVYHTGASMTAERLSFSEVPGTFLDLRVDRLSDGSIGMTIEDVTGTVAVEDRLRRQASHDALTGLPNRTLLEERLAAASDSAIASAPVALILIDVDKLRELNESFGLNFGDQLLVDLGRRLVQEVRGAAIVSRLGGGQFAVLTLPCSTEAEALERAAAASNSLARPFDISGHMIHCEASVGVALAPGDADDWRMMLRNASLALQEHKKRSLDQQNSAGYCVFRRTAEPSSIRRLALLSELRQGLANNALELRYVPQIDLHSGRVSKVEAVLHWERPEDSTKLPADFLEMAEQSGLIQPLTRWILAEAARASTTLLGRSGPAISRPTSPLIITTNLSFRNLFDPDLFSFVQMLIRSGELLPNLVEIEVSETELMDNPTRSQEVLLQLSELGLRFVVDDFGTGYTSLATMQHLPVVGLKIDRSYVSTISSVPADAAIVRSTIDLSHELGLSVCADGVGDPATLARLAEFGCDTAQGAHLSGPVTMDALPTRIAELEGAVRGWIGTSDTAHV
ncbi:diguanylate cyclase (GGDEF) domain-containing protein [Actinobacteria bacterium IMCC26207]|nr:diguanylate cyclase (GGDEF) domain-containing protein [Actinobacteria bacterium IMCC26207]